jgi:hypothetical protein
MVGLRSAWTQPAPKAEAKAKAIAYVADATGALLGATGDVEADGKKGRGKGKGKGKGRGNGNADKETDKSTVDPKKGAKGGGKDGGKDGKPRRPCFHHNRGHHTQGAQRGCNMDPKECHWEHRIVSKKEWEVWEQNPPVARSRQGTPQVSPREGGDDKGKKGGGKGGGKKGAKALAAVATDEAAVAVDR